MVKFLGVLSLVVVSVLVHAPDDRGQASGCQAPSCCRPRLFPRIRGRMAARRCDGCVLVSTTVLASQFRTEGANSRTLSKQEVDTIEEHLRRQKAGDFSLPPGVSEFKPDPEAPLPPLPPERKSPLQRLGDSGLHELKPDPRPTPKPQSVYRMEPPK